ncbi:DUF2149 domain-containing protein [Castellaniella hirudinis]|uniref:DUF2149 domain-containing protein n=1 Tax=Castellaniella hirudinis TaxID=1144617 RepID=A0ABV8RWM8_9BURK
MSRRRSILRGTSANSDDMDPLGFLINLFDVALVFALALMIALVSNLKMADLLTAKDFTMVKNPGKPDMEIITREAGKVSRYVAGDAQAGSRQGERVGTAYRLQSGEIIYVPDNPSPSEAQ